MVGSLLVYPPNVAVETTSVWNTLYPVQREDFQPLDTMRYEISLPPCSVKFAKKCALNPNCSQLHLTNSTGPQLIDRMVQSWMCQLTEFGEAGFKKLTMM